VVGTNFYHYLREAPQADRSTLPRSTAPHPTPASPPHFGGRRCQVGLIGTPERTCPVLGQQTGRHHRVVGLTHQCPLWLWRLTARPRWQHTRLLPSSILSHLLCPLWCRGSRFQCSPSSISHPVSAVLSGTHSMRAEV
jgi:hypothetical protein